MKCLASSSNHKVSTRDQIENVNSANDSLTVLARHPHSVGINYI